MTDPAAIAPTSRGDVPAFDVDLHSEEMLLDPYPTYARFREAGGVIWLDRHEMYAVPRYAELVDVLMHWKVFASGHGVGMNDFVAKVARTTLQTDPPEHDTYRKLEGRPLLPSTVKVLEPELRELAERTVTELKQRDGFDGVGDLAAVLPLGIVADRVGLPDAGRERMLDWAAAGFDSFGMMDNQRTQQGLQTMREAAEFMHAAADQLKPDGWAEKLLHAAEAHGLDRETCVTLISDYIYPSLDTTIHGISAGLKLFSDNPDQWQLLRSDRSLLPNAVSEVIRLGTPILWFTRLATEDYQLGDTLIPEGSRLVALYGSANRDERRFPDPERFDITRESTAQLGFGKGKHACMGMPLARLEMQIIFDVMADHVERIDAGDGVRAMNNVLYGYESLDVSFA